jgi:hypothetical protein
MSTNELLAAVGNLDPELIRDQLLDLESQKKALRVLLRTAEARRCYGSPAVPQIQAQPFDGKGGANGNIRA